MGVFLGIGVFLLTGWSVMFYSIVYRWYVPFSSFYVRILIGWIYRTFIQWPNLGCFTVASLVLIIASLVLGVICRLNFGKGLKQYCMSHLLFCSRLFLMPVLVHAEAALASANFAPEVFTHDEEKGPMDFDIKVPATFDPPEAYYVAPTVPRSGDSQQTHTLRQPQPAIITSSQPSSFNVPYNVPF